MKDSRSLGTLEGVPAREPAAARIASACATPMSRPSSTRDGNREELNSARSGEDGLTAAATGAETDERASSEELYDRTEWVVLFDRYDDRSLTSTAPTATMPGPPVPARSEAFDSVSACSCSCR